MTAGTAERSGAAAKVNFRLSAAEIDELLAEARADGYARFSDYLRALLRVGRDHRAELHREQGRHYVRDGVWSGALVAAPPSPAPGPGQKT